jgi:hypothetical protein
MLATIVCSGAKRKTVIEGVREYQPVNSRSIGAITNSPFVRYNNELTIVRSLSGTGFQPVKAENGRLEAPKANPTAQKRSKKCEQRTKKLVNLAIVLRADGTPCWHRLRLELV